MHGKNICKRSPYKNLYICISLFRPTKTTYKFVFTKISSNNICNYCNFFGYFVVVVFDL